MIGVSNHVVNAWFDRGIIDGWRIPGPDGEACDRRYLRESVVAFMEKYRMPADLLISGPWHRVMLVGVNDPNAISAIAETLSPREGYLVRHAPDVLDAAMICAQLRPTAVVFDRCDTMADILLPRLGWATTRIALMGEDDEDVERCYKAGYTDHLRKPCTGDEIALAVLADVELRSKRVRHDSSLISPSKRKVTPALNGKAHHGGV